MANPGNVATACSSGISHLAIALMTVILCSRSLHFFLKFLGQPRVISEAIVGLVLGNTGLLGYMDLKVPRIARMMSELAIMAHFFVIGLEMEPRNLLRRPSKVLSVGYASVLSTCVAVFCAKPLLVAEFRPHAPFSYTVSTALVLSNTSSSVLTRLVTELKIGKSKIGRDVVAAAVHSDMVSLLAMAVFLCPQYEKGNPKEPPSTSLDASRTLINIILICMQTWFLLRVFIHAIKWVNAKNPEGKPINRTHLGAIILVLAGWWQLGTLYGFSGTFEAFLIGLALPREGRISRVLIRNINVALNEFLFPFYYGILGSALSFENWQGSKSLMDVLLLVMVGMVGKVSGTLIAAVHIGYAVPEAICLGLLLNVKGHFHILSAINALETHVLNNEGCMTSVIAVLATIVYIPLVVLFIVWRARKRHSKLQLTLQWHNPDSELKMMFCLHGTHNVPACIKLIESSKGGPLCSSLTVYAMDMVELTGRTAAVLTTGTGQGVDAVDVADDEIIEMRKQISLAFNAYLCDTGGGVTIRRLLALSHLATIHQDVCNAAHDALAVVIILPFHKLQTIDGTLTDSDHDFRSVNKKVLRHAPCSVGIFVDRGLGRITRTSTVFGLLQAAVVFVGGPDDREALFLAARMAHHPEVKLTTIRFLLDRPVDSTSYSGSTRSMMDHRYRADDLTLDDECIADFYEQNVANGGPVEYIEKYVSNGTETLASLRALEGNYSLIIVGLAGRGSSILTAGMCDWVEYPELGPLGDTLAHSEFSKTASILIIQQHNPKRQEEMDAMEDNLSIS